MISQREIQIVNIKNNFPDNSPHINELKIASDAFDELVKSGIADYRGNRVASSVHLTSELISFNNK